MRTSSTTSSIKLIIFAFWALAALTWINSYATASSDSEDTGSDSVAADSSADDDALGNSKSTEYFSVPAFFITFRETIEAVVIISVLLQFLTKIDRDELKPAVWRGSFAGLAAAIMIGVCFIIAFYETNKQFFEGRTEYIVEAILMLIAAVIVTVLSASMLKIAHMREKWERKLQAGMAKAEQKGTDLRYSYMFWLPFISVLREGIETIIFLAGTSSNYPAKAIPIPGILGLLVGLAIGWFIFRVGKEASLKRLLVASTILLLFIAAGLFSHGVHELQELGVFGTWDGERNYMNSPSWNICDAANNNDEFWGLMRALVGYTCKPTPIEIIAYVLYWVVAITFLCYKLNKGCFSYRQAAEDEKLARLEKEAQQEEKGHYSEDMELAAPAVAA